MATHSSILDWKIPRTEEPGGLQSMSQTQLINFHFNYTYHIPTIGQVLHRCQLIFFFLLLKLFFKQLCVCVCVHMHTQLCLTLCNPMNCSPRGSSVHDIFQARILEQVAISSSRRSSRRRIKPTSLACPALAGGFLTTVPPGKPLNSFTEVLFIPKKFTHFRNITQ